MCGVDNATTTFCWDFYRVCLPHSRGAAFPESTTRSRMWRAMVVDVDRIQLVRDLLRSFTRKDFFNFLPLVGSLMQTWPRFLMTQASVGADHRRIGRRLPPQDGPVRAHCEDGFKAHSDAQGREALQASRRSMPQPGGGIQPQVEYSTAQYTESQVKILDSNATSAILRSCM